MFCTKTVAAFPSTGRRDPPPGVTLGQSWRTLGYPGQPASQWSRRAASPQRRVTSMHNVTRKAGVDRHITTRECGLRASACA
jgi:hypothetical protein